MLTGRRPFAGDDVSKTLAHVIAIDPDWGALSETVPPVLVTGEGSVTAGTYPETRPLNGGFCVLKCGVRAEAERWAAKIAAACRCAQELREFMFDPES